MNEHDHKKAYSHGTLEKASISKSSGSPILTKEVKSVFELGRVSLLMDRAAKQSSKASTKA